VPGHEGAYDQDHACDPSVIAVRGTWLLYYTGGHDDGFPYEGDDPRSSVGLAVSDDGRTFTRVGGALELPHHPYVEGSYGVGQQAVVYAGGDLYMVYTDLADQGDGQIRVARSVCGDDIVACAAFEHAEELTAFTGAVGGRLLEVTDVGSWSLDAAWDDQTDQLLLIANATPQDGSAGEARVVMARYNVVDYYGRGYLQRDGGEAGTTAFASAVAGSSLHEGVAAVRRADGALSRSALGGEDALTFISAAGDIHAGLDYLRFADPGGPGLGDASAPTRRLSHPAAGHMWTTSAAERAGLIAAGWTDEGAAFALLDAPMTIDGVTAAPLRRLYEPTSGRHLWTADPHEASALGAAGWADEGITGYLFPSPVEGARALTRLYSPSTGRHLWTADAYEVSLLGAAGWSVEGVVGYVFDW